jgi:hypothetical protein
MLELANKDIVSMSLKITYGKRGEDVVIDKNFHFNRVLDT